MFPTTPKGKTKTLRKENTTKYAACVAGDESRAAFPILRYLQCSAVASPPKRAAVASQGSPAAGVGADAHEPYPMGCHHFAPKPPNDRQGRSLQ